MLFQSDHPTDFSETARVLEESGDNYGKKVSTCLSFKAMTSRLVESVRSRFFAQVEFTFRHNEPVPSFWPLLVQRLLCRAGLPRL